MKGEVNGISFEFQRGFVVGITLPLSAFTEDVARAIFSTQPVLSIRFSCRVPEPQFDGYSWRDEGIENGPENIPADLWFSGIDQWGNLRTGCIHETQDEAYDALSREARNWGRSLVGLPPIG